MKNNKQAFTIVELLAVIAILAMILLVVMPSVLNIIDDSKKDSYINQIKLIEDMAGIYASSKVLTYNEDGMVKVTLKKNS